MWAQVHTWSTSTLQCVTWRLGATLVQMWTPGETYGTCLKDSRAYNIYKNISFFQCTQIEARKKKCFQQKYMEQFSGSSIRVIKALVGSWMRQLGLNLSRLKQGIHTSLKNKQKRINTQQNMSTSMLSIYAEHAIHVECTLVYILHNCS